MNEQERTASGRRYDRDFKNNAVGLVVQGGKSISQVSRDLGVSAWSLTRWVAAARRSQAQSEPKTLATESDEARELRRLRQENDDLREQRDILISEPVNRFFAGGGVFPAEPAASAPARRAR